jgi:hypothetical protein
MITGLSVADGLPTQKTQTQTQGQGLNISTRRRGDGSSVRFTFVVYENQRRWLGIGWTYSLFPSERGAWTDEHLNSVPPKDSFELPDVQTGGSKWRWVEGSEWRIEGADHSTKSDPKISTSEGWIYYDNKVRCFSNVLQDLSLMNASGMMAAEPKMAGTDTRADASGTAMPSWWRCSRMAPTKPSQTSRKL